MIYGDYNRTIVGFHGTRRAKSLLLVQRKAEFQASHNRDDWLGHGIYFWEHPPRQAYAWAQQRSRNDAAVVASMIRRGNCLDLLDPPNLDVLVGCHDLFVASREAVGEKPLKNFNSRKFLDCAVLEFACELIEKQGGHTIDSCRGVYVPTKRGQRIWPRSLISSESHIQLCVRNRSCIMGTRLVHPISGDLK